MICDMAITHFNGSVYGDIYVKYKTFILSLYELKANK